MYKRNRLVFGVGRNDADYLTQWKNPDGTSSKCPFYVRWKDMLKRCYSKKFQETRPTYKGCSVCEEWRTFSVFKSWMEKQDWKDMHLDKDLLIQNNTEYCPSGCVFIPHKVNTLLMDCRASRGEYPIGVNLNKRDNSFTANITINSEYKFLGNHKTPEDAHKAWQKAKVEQIKTVALEQADIRVRDALLLRVAQLEDDIANNRGTVKL